ncbi:unnamed protein product [Aphanomyces euteiches]
MKTEVARLRLWKEQAIKLMASWGPKRTKLQQERRETLNLKKKLVHMEQQVMERVALSEMLAEMKVQDTLLMDKLSKTLREVDQMKQKFAHEVAAHLQTRQQLSCMEDCFEKHIEQMLLIRDRFEFLSQSQNFTSSEYKIARLEDESTAAFEERKLVAGMTRIAEKCLVWFEERLLHEMNTLEAHKNSLGASEKEKETITEEVTKANIQLQGMAKRIESLECIISELRSENEAKEQLMQSVKADLEKQAHHVLDGKEVLKRMLRDVRQYLHLTHLEVKKKFGYVPDAIAHHQVWESISTSMKDFDHFLQGIKC